MMPLRTTAPSFNLPDVISGKNKSIKAVMGEEGLVVMFLCAHCPYVKHLEKGILFIANEYQQRGVGFVAISSNNVESFPTDAPEKLQEQANNRGFPFPYLYDESQEVAKAYQAACTPDFYLFDKELKCIYRGRFDAATPSNNEPVTGDELRNAIDSLLKGDDVSSDQKPSIGCNIKWK